MGSALLILAAGAGSRFGGLKQLAPIGPSGETLLEYSAYDAVAAGFSRVILVVRPEDEAAFRARLDGMMGRRVPVAYVHQRLSDLPDGFSPPAGRTRPWGTGHAVLAAADEVDGPFAMVNADDYYGKQPFVELARFLRAPGRGGLPTLALCAYEVADTLTDAGPVSRAVCRLDEAGRLREIVELKKVRRVDGRILGADGRGAEIVLREDELVSMNIWGLPRELLPELRRRFATFLAGLGDDAEAEFMLPEVIHSWLRERQMAVEVLPGGREWCGITFREDRERVSRSISDRVARGEYPEELWA